LSFFSLPLQKKISVPVTQEFFSLRLLLFLRSRARTGSYQKLNRVRTPATEIAVSVPVIQQTFRYQDLLDLGPAPVFCIRIFTVNERIPVPILVFQDLIDVIFQGYNCSVFAYGATGAGKTFTMLGSQVRTIPYTPVPVPVTIFRVNSLRFSRIRYVRADLDQDFSIRFY